MNSCVEISWVQQVLCLWRLLWKRLWSGSCRRGDTNVSALNSSLSTHHWIPLVNSKVFIVLFNILVLWIHSIYSETYMVKDKTLALSVDTDLIWGFFLRTNQVLECFFSFFISHRWECWLFDFFLILFRIVAVNGAPEDRKGLRAASLFSQLTKHRIFKVWVTPHQDHRRNVTAVSNALFY